VCLTSAALAIVFVGEPWLGPLQEEAPLGDGGHHLFYAGLPVHLGGPCDGEGFPSQQSS
jgi:hypothetical protein